MIHALVRCAFVTNRNGFIHGAAQRQLQQHALYLPSGVVQVKMIKLVRCQVLGHDQRMSLFDVPLGEILVIDKTMTDKHYPRLWREAVLEDVRTSAPADVNIRGPLR